MAHTDYIKRIYKPLASCLSILIGLSAPSEASAALRQFDYSDYAAALKSYVDDRGLVNYIGLKANRQGLDKFAASLAELDPQVYDSWNEKEKIAFWINAYNALTLVAIIDHYPIKASLLGKLRFPGNSIRQIPGVWDKLQFTVMWQKITQDGITRDPACQVQRAAHSHGSGVCGAWMCDPPE